MFIVSKRNIIIPGGKDREDVSIAKDFVGEVPDWVGKTAYFKALAADGKIVLSDSGKPKKPRKPAKPDKEEAAPPAAPAGQEAP